MNGRELPMAPSEGSAAAATIIEAMIVMMFGAAWWAGARIEARA